MVTQKDMETLKRIISKKIWKGKVELFFNSPEDYYLRLTHNDIQITTVLLNQQILNILKYPNALENLKQSIIRELLSMFIKG